MIRVLNARNPDAKRPANVLLFFESDVEVFTIDEANDNRGGV